MKNINMQIHPVLYGTAITISLIAGFLIGNNYGSSNAPEADLEISLLDESAPHTQVTTDFTLSSARAELQGYSDKVDSFNESMNKKKMTNTDYANTMTISASYGLLSMMVEACTIRRYDHKGRLHEKWDVDDTKCRELADKL